MRHRLARYATLATAAALLLAALLFALARSA
jgi:hypothetical protein